MPTPHPAPDASGPPERPAAADPEHSASADPGHPAPADPTRPAVSASADPGRQRDQATDSSALDRARLAAPVPGGPDQSEILDWEWAALPHEEDPSVVYPDEDEAGDDEEWLDEISYVLASPGVPVQSPGAAAQDPGAPVQSPGAPAQDPGAAGPGPAPGAPAQSPGAARPRARSQSSCPGSRCGRPRPRSPSSPARGFRAGWAGGCDGPGSGAGHAGGSGAA